MWGGGKRERLEGGREGEKRVSREREKRVGLSQGMNIIAAGNNARRQFVNKSNRHDTYAKSQHSRQTADAERHQWACSIFQAYSATAGSLARD